MSRYKLEQMYLDIHGERNVNDKWLATMNDDELVAIITAYAVLGKRAYDATQPCAESVLRASLSASRRDKSEQENS